MPQAKAAWNCGRVFNRCMSGVQPNTSVARTGQTELAQAQSDSQALAALGTARVDDRAGRRTRRVCQLVAAAFVGPKPFPKAQVNHKNGCKTDDSAQNLEWVTAAQNIRHSVEFLGRDYRGTKSVRSRLTEAQVLEIRERAARGETYRGMCADYGVTNVCVKLAAQGITYANVGGPRSAPRDAAERKRLGIPNHAPGVGSNRQRKK